MTAADMEHAAEMAEVWGLGARATAFRFAARLKRAAPWQDGDRLSENLDAWAERLAAARVRA